MTQQHTGSRPPDASMLLLNNLMHNPLDQGYAEAAARRRDLGQDPRRRPGLVAGVALVVVALLLSTAYEQVQRSKSAAEAARQDLIERIGARTAHIDRLEADLAGLRAEVDAARERALAVTDAQASRGLSRLELTTGVAPADGPGIVVTVDDAERRVTDTSDPRAGQGPDLGRVLDSDLQRLVNGLWAAGAEAIAINGQRLTSLSAIRSAGHAILVDYRPLSPPYVVRAIGDPKKLEARFAESPAGRGFSTLQRAYGIRFDVERKKKLNLPGASSVTLSEAREPTPEPRPAKPDDQRGTP